jgi:hypothetical protein
MAGLLKWIKGNTTRLLDPNRDARIANAASHLERELAAQRKNFTLSAALKGVELFDEDVPLATRRAYSSLVQRAWRDGELTEGEQKTLKWAAHSLGLSEQLARDLQRDLGLTAFQETLAHAIDDGVLDDGEVQSLQKLARSLEWPLGRFASILRPSARACSEGSS